MIYALLTSTFHHLLFLIHSEQQQETRRKREAALGHAGNSGFRKDSFLSLIFMADHNVLASIQIRQVPLSLGYIIDLSERPSFFVITSSGFS